jgi:hypothetical protein
MITLFNNIVLIKYLFSLIFLSLCLIMTLRKNRNIQYVSTKKALSPNLILINDPSIITLHHVLTALLYVKFTNIDRNIRVGKAISVHETASVISISCTLFIPYRIASFLNMEGIDRPRHELGKHSFHYETKRTVFPLQQFRQTILSLNCKQDKQDCNVRIMCMQRPENVYRNKRLLYCG